MTHSVTRYCCAFICIVCSLAAADSTLVDDARIDVVPPATAASDPTVICDSVGHYTVVWYEAGDDSIRVMGRAFYHNGEPRTETIQILNTLPSATIKVAASERGDFVLTWFQPEHSSSDVAAHLYLRRFRSDLTPRNVFRQWVNQSADALEVRSCAAAMDRDGNVFVAYAEKLDGVYQERITVAYYDDGGEQGSWTIGAGSGYDSYRVSACCFVRPDHINLFLQLDEEVSSGYVDQALSRILRFDGSDVVSVGGFQELVRAKTWSGAGDWHIDGAAIERWNAAIAVFNDTTGARLARIDSTGALDGQLVTLAMNPSAGEWKIRDYNGLRCAAGLNGAYAVLRRTVDDSLLMSWADSLKGNPTNTVTVTGGRWGTASVALDGSGGRLVAWDERGSIFLRRFGAAALPQHRINSDGANPLACASALGPNGYWGVAAWSCGDRETIGLSVTGINHWSHSLWPEWAVTFPGITRFGMPRVDLVDTTACVAYLRDEGGADTSLVLALRGKRGGALLTERTVNDNGTRPARADFAAAEDSIVVLWEDRRAAHGDTSWIYGQAFDRAGSVVGGNFAVAPGSDPALCSGGGRFALSWTEATVKYIPMPGGGTIPFVTSDIYYAPLGAGGQPELTPVTVDTTDGNTHSSDICPVFGGTFVVWLRQQTAGSTIYGRCFDGQTPVSDPIAYSECTFASSPCVAAIGDSCAVVTWVNEDAGAVEYLTVDGYGEAVGTISRVNRESIDLATSPSPSVSATNGNEMLITWLNRRYRGTDQRQALAELVLVDGITGVAYPSAPPASAHTSAPRPQTDSKSFVVDLRGRIVPRALHGKASAGLRIRVDRCSGHVRTELVTGKTDAR